MLWKVIVQKTVVNKHKPTDKDRLARRRVVLVEANEADEAMEFVAHNSEAHGPDYVEVLDAEPVEAGFAVLAP